MLAKRRGPLVSIRLHKPKPSKRRRKGKQPMKWSIAGLSLATIGVIAAIVLVTIALYNRFAPQQVKDVVDPPAA